MSGFMMTYKGVPSTYNKDLQEDKEPLFDTVDSVWASLRIAEGVIATLEVIIYPGGVLSVWDNLLQASHRFMRIKCGKP